MDYLYGNFSDKQIQANAKYMHTCVHKLLLYKDKNIRDKCFDSDFEFNKYFMNLLYKFAGFNKILNEPVQMISLLSVLQTAYDECNSDKFNFEVFRKLILDAHGYIKAMFESR